MIKVGDRVSPHYNMNKVGIVTNITYDTNNNNMWLAGGTASPKVIVEVKLLDNSNDIINYIMSDLLIVNV